MPTASRLTPCASASLTATCLIRGSPGSSAAASAAGAVLVRPTVSSAGVRLAQQRIGHRTGCWPSTNPGQGTRHRMMFDVPTDRRSAAPALARRLRNGTSRGARACGSMSLLRFFRRGSARVDIEEEGCRSAPGRQNRAPRTRRWVDRAPAPGSIQSVRSARSLRPGARRLRKNVAARALPARMARRRRLRRLALARCE